MKTLNFSVVEKLQSLLDKSCSQTIRPAWENGIITDSLATPSYKKKVIRYKPPRFEVGDKVELLWEKDSKYDWFCPICGKEVEWMGNNFCDCGHHLRKKEPFNKHLETVEITEVFKIEMWKRADNNAKIIILKNNEGYKLSSSVLDETRDWQIDLAKRDGFSSVEYMFNILDRMYKLNESKEFWVYRWEWLNE